MFTVIKDAGIFLDTVVGNGWSILDYTTKDRSNVLTEEVISSKLNWSPLEETYKNGDGGGLISQFYSPSDDKAKTLYLEWNDGVGVEFNKNTFHYFLTTTAIYTKVAYDDIRCGVLIEPWTEVMYVGTYPYVPEFLEGSEVWGNPPADAVPTGEVNDLYSGLPVVGSSTNPGAYGPGITGAHVIGYKSQPGYRSNHESESSHLMWGSEPAFTVHFFGGVEKGSPYFYMVFESEMAMPGGGIDKYYCHMGLGNIVKTGVWKGGQFSVSTYSHPSFLDSLGSNYNSAMFDSSSCYYTQDEARSKVFFSIDMRPYDSEDLTTLPDTYRFGYTQGIYRSYGNSFGGLCNPLVQDSKNTWNGRTMLFPQHIRVLDVYNTDYYMIVGTAPAIKSLQIDYVNPGTEIVDNGITWKIFPIKSKTHSGDAPRSGFYGYAFRID